MEKCFKTHESCELMDSKKVPMITVGRFFCYIGYIEIELITPIWLRRKAKKYYPCYPDLGVLLSLRLQNKHTGAGLLCKIHSLPDPVYLRKRMNKKSVKTS